MCLIRYEHLCMDFKLEDLKITAWDPFPSGGMRTGKPPIGIKAEHIPSGRSSISTSERSQYKNKELAIKQLKALLKSEGYIDE